jgi:hypothetical protein
MLGRLDHVPQQRCGDLLTPRTLAAIAAFDAGRMTADARPTGASGLRIPLRDWAAAAVLALVSGAVLWPMIAHGRTASQQIACQANLALAGRAMGLYAEGADGLMPATQYRLGDPWNQPGRLDEQGNAQSNSAHLFQLIRLGYMSADDLRCPSNEQAPEFVGADWRDWPVGHLSSYSYQNQYADGRHRLDGEPERAALADRSPFFGRDGWFQFVDQDGDYRHDFDANSENHGRRGQNVLMADGRATFSRSPYLPSGDGIYHAGAEGLDYYTGHEGPADEGDSFLVP